MSERNTRSQHLMHYGLLRAFRLLPLASFNYEPCKLPGKCVNGRCMAYQLSDVKKTSPDKLTADGVIGNVFTVNAKEVFEEF